MNTTERPGIISFRRQILCFLLGMMLLPLCGCVEGEGEQVNAGRRMMKDYFAKDGRGASLVSIYADVTRPDIDRLEISDFVKGEYKVGNETYEFWANVETGSIYTSEKLEEFSASVLKIQAAALGFDPADCSCYASITIEPGFTGESGNSKGQTDTVTLNDVLPVTITDMDAFAASALESGDVSVGSYIVCRSFPTEDTLSQYDLSEWKCGQITFCLLDDPDTALPTDKYDILGYWIDHRDKVLDVSY